MGFLFKDTLVFTSEGYASIRSKKVARDPILTADGTFKRPIDMSHRTPGKYTGLSVRLDLIGLNRLPMAFHVTSDQCFLKSNGSSIQAIDIEVGTQLTQAIRSLPNCGFLALATDGSSFDLASVSVTNVLKFGVCEVPVYDVNMGIGGTFIVNNGVVAITC